MIWWVGYLALCWLAADFLSGLFHWFEDRYLDEHTPILGTLVGGPNALHHSQPLVMLEGSYWHRNWTTIVPCLIVAALVALVNPWFALPFVFASQANEIHAWAHQKGKVHWLIALFQKAGLLQSPESHGVHHRSPFDCNYCVMTEVLNPILDTAGLWVSLEYLVSFTGLKPVK